MDIGISELITAVILGILGLAFSLQYYLKGWRNNKVESSLITMMHKELERYAKQNKELCDEVEKLRVQLRALNTQLSQLIVENERLHVEVTSLSNQLEKIKLNSTGGYYGSASKA